MKDDELEKLLTSRGDHNSEVAGFMRALQGVVDKYWFIGCCEIVGGLERVKYRYMSELEKHPDE